MTNPDRVAFSIFGKDIYWYAILMALGIICAALIAGIESKRKKMHPDTVIDICLWTVPLGIVCARLYYVLFNWNYYIADPIRIIQIWEGGLAIPGAVLGGALGLFIYSRIKKQRFLRYADIIVPGLAVAQAIGRWGNFFNQEAFGPQISLVTPTPWWFRFPFLVRIDEYVGGTIVGWTYHMATFFYESVCCLLIFAIVWLQRKKFKHDGDAFLTYLFLYGAERMVMEGLRTDALMVGNIRITQLLCAVMFVGIAVFAIVRFFAEKSSHTRMWPKPIIEVCVPIAQDNNIQNTQHEIVAENEDLLEFGMSPNTVADEESQQQSSDKSPNTDN